MPSKKKVKSVERQKSQVKADIIAVNQKDANQNINKQVVHVVFPADTELRKVKKRKRAKPRNTQRNKLLKELKEAVDEFDRVQNAVRERKINIPSELGLTAINMSDLKTIADIKKFIEEVVNKTNKLRELLEKGTQQLQPSPMIFGGNPFGIIQPRIMQPTGQPQIIPPSVIPHQIPPVVIPPIRIPQQTGQPTQTGEDATAKALREIAEETKRELEREGKSTEGIMPPTSGQTDTPPPTPTITIPSSERGTSTPTDPFPNKDAPSDFNEIKIGIQKITLEMPPQKRIDEGKRLLQRMEEIQNERLKNQQPLDINFVRERNGLALRLDSIISQSQRGLGDDDKIKEFIRLTGASPRGDGLYVYTGEGSTEKTESGMTTQELLQFINSSVGQSLINTLKSSTGSTPRTPTPPTELNLTKDVLDIGGKGTEIIAPVGWSNVVKRVLKYQKDILFDVKEPLPQEFHIPVASIQNLIVEREGLSNDYNEIMSSFSEQQIAYIDSKYAPIDKRIRQILIEEPKDTLRYVYDQQKKPYKSITQAGERTKLQSKVMKEIEGGKKLKDKFIEDELTKGYEAIIASEDLLNNFKKTKPKSRKDAEARLKEIQNKQDELGDIYDKLPNTARGLIQTDYDKAVMELSTQEAIIKSYIHGGILQTPEKLKPTKHIDYQGRDEDMKLLKEYVDKPDKIFGLKVKEAVKNLFGEQFFQFIQTKNKTDKKTIINEELGNIGTTSPQEFSQKFSQYKQADYSPFQEGAGQDTREEFEKQQAKDLAEAQRQKGLEEGHSWQFAK